MKSTPWLLLLLFAFVVSLSACSARACTIRANNKKFNYYNGIQYKGVKKR